MKEGWMKNDECWRMNDEGWWFQAVEGFCDGQTNGRTFVNVESLSRLKTSLTSFKSEMDGWTTRLPIKFLLHIVDASKISLKYLKLVYLLLRFLLKYFWILNNYVDEHITNICFELFIDFFLIFQFLLKQK